MSADPTPRVTPAELIDLSDEADARGQSTNTERTALTSLLYVDGRPVAWAPRVAS